MSLIHDLQLHLQRNTLQKNITMCNKNYKSSHQNGIKFRILFARKAGLFLDI